MASLQAFLFFLPRALVRPNSPFPSPSPFNACHAAYEPPDHLVHYSLLIWSHIGAKGASFLLKTIFFLWSPLKEIPWGQQKILLPCEQLVRPCNSSEPVQDFFFPQNGKDNKPNHPLLLRLPYLRIKPKVQSQQGKK